MALTPMLARAAWAALRPQSARAASSWGLPTQLLRGFASLPAPVDAVSEVQKMRNFAIIAHVDHGKTTLMDVLLKSGQQGSAGGDSVERAMDSLSLEKERGITIQAKYTSFAARGHTFNAVDTPGHADFGGEVERVLGMVDGVLLLVDAQEGPLAQTKFVTQKALQQGLSPILVLNKVDRESVTDQRCSEVMTQVFDLFSALGATDEQLDFPTLYASARMGWASTTWEGTRELLKGPPNPPNGVDAILQTIIDHVPPPLPAVTTDEHFRMVVTMMEKDNYLGRLVTGRIASGSVKVGDRLKALQWAGAAGLSGAAAPAAGVAPAEGRVTRIMKRLGGFGRVNLDTASAGDIVSIAGVGGASVTDTLCGLEVAEPLQTQAIDPPTLTMTFGVNDSPLAGRDGTHLTGTKIGSRLLAEAETNVSIRVMQQAGGGDSFEVQGRGELQLGVLIENMRREGFEFSVSPPEVLLRKDDDGRSVEPVEEVMCEVNDAQVGQVIESLTLRGAELTEMVPGSGDSGRTRIMLRCPARGLLGYKSMFNTLTRGEGLLVRSFAGYEPVKAGLGQTRKGVLVSMAQGTTTLFALGTIEERGTLFIGPQVEVYDGMIIGESARDGDLDVNPTKEKKLTNIRNTGSEEQIRLSPPRKITLEDAIGYVREGELIEVTPTAVRLRKRELNSSVRKTADRKNAKLNNAAK